MKYVVEYILNTPREWAVWFKYGQGTKSGPMNADQLMCIDKERMNGKYIFFSVEVIR